MGSPGIRSMGKTQYNRLSNGKRNLTQGDTVGICISRHATPRFRRMPGRKFQGMFFIAYLNAMADSISRAPALSRRQMTCPPL